MKKLKKMIIYLLVAVVAVSVGYGIGAGGHALILRYRVYKMNAHIKYLHDEEGYSWESARKIGATEAGFIPVDSEYKALKED